MNDEFQYKFDPLKQEMDTLQSSMKTYDGFLMTIKGRAISIFSAVIFFALDKDQPLFLAFGALAHPPHPGGVYGRNAPQPVARDLY